MSIPTPFNPLGTLGADYVKNGLLLLFDATREPIGTMTSLTNFATGEAVAFSGELTGDGTKINGPRSSHADASCSEILAQAKSFEMNVGFPKKGEGFVRIAAFGRNGMVNPSTNRTYLELPEYLFVWKDHNTYEVIKESYDVACFYFTEEYFELYGGELRNIHHGSGQTYFGDFTLYQNAELHSIRIYDRELTAAEKAQNWAIDKKKFSL